MDLSNHSHAELEQFAISLFEELARRQTQVAVLNQLSNDGLKNMGFTILEIFGRRFKDSSDEDKRLWLQAGEQLLMQLLPGPMLAYRDHAQLIQLALRLQVIASRIIRTARKDERNAIIHRLLTEEGITSWKLILEKLKAVDPSWVTVKTTGETVSVKALKNMYKDWLAKQPPESNPR